MPVAPRAPRPASPETNQYWTAWAVRLLIVVLVLQVIGWFAAVAAIRPSALHLPWPGKRITVESPPGSRRPTVPSAVSVKSYTDVLVNGERIRYAPLDLTDAVEYAANYVHSDPKAKVRIEHVVSVEAGRAMRRLPR